MVLEKGGGGDLFLALFLSSEKIKRVHSDCTHCETNTQKQRKHF